MRFTIDLTSEEYWWIKHHTDNMDLEEYVRSLIKKDAEETQGSKNTNIWETQRKPKYRFSWEQESGSEYTWTHSDEKYMF